MPSIVVDTSVLYAAFDASDRHHRAAAAFLQHNTLPLVTNIPVLTEATYMLRSAPQTQRRCLQFAADAFEIDGQAGADLPRIVELMAKYADLPADFADASLVALCERRGIGSIATLDSDFDVYRRSDGSRIDNIFVRS